jgi:hypothetical protein
MYYIYILIYIQQSSATLQRLPNASLAFAVNKINSIIVANVIFMGSLGLVLLHTKKC